MDGKENSVEADPRTTTEFLSLEKRAVEIAGMLREAGSAVVVSHIDADGITSASIASTALDRAGISHEVRFVRQLDDRVIASLREDAPPLVWFTDLGSGVRERLEGIPAVVTDHHIPSITQADVPLEARGDLMALAEALEERDAAAGGAPPGGGPGTGAATGGDGPGGTGGLSGTPFAELNPHLVGLDGGIVLSGAGAAYLVARAMDPGNTDLAGLAVVGAVGDLQDSRSCRLEGINRAVILDGQDAGVLEAREDLRLFGRETRPVHLMLRYASDPAIPGLTGSGESCISFLQGLDVSLKSGEKWLSWSQMDVDTRRRIASALMVHLVRRGVGHRAASRLIGEGYSLLAEKEGTELRDAKEFATLLNSCGRYDKAPIGMAVCKGDRAKMYAAAKQLLTGHRRNLVETLDLVRDIGIETKGCVQHFHGGDRILDSIVGIVAGMILGSGEMGVDPGKPLFGFADSSDEPDMVKVSGRTTRKLVDGGVNLAKVMGKVADGLDGVGGGHNIAAGAKVPRGTEEEFIRRVEALLADVIDP